MIKTKTIQFLKSYYLSVISVIFFFLSWEIVSRYKIINPIYISSPLKIFKEGTDLVVSGKIFSNYFSSMELFFYGYFSAVFVGVVGGLIIGFNKSLYKLLVPYVLALNSLPVLALIPLIIIWFGIGIFSKVVIVFLVVSKLILINTIDAARNCEKEYILMAKSFGASKMQILKSVIFYNSLPVIFSSLHLSIGRGLVGLIIAEAFGYGIGLGFLIIFYGNTFQTTKLMFIIFVLIMTSLFFSKIVFMFEKKIIKWKY